MRLDAMLPKVNVSRALIVLPPKVSFNPWTSRSHQFRDFWRYWNVVDKKFVVESGILKSSSKFY